MMQYMYLIQILITIYRLAKQCQINTYKNNLITTQINITINIFNTFNTYRFFKELILGY